MINYYFCLQKPSKITFLLPQHFLGLINFWNFNLYNLQCMLTAKLEELGYKYEDFYNKSNMKQKIEENYEDKNNKQIP